MKIFIIATVLGLPFNLHAQFFNRIICIDEIIFDDDFFDLQVGPIPVGCEVIDCCEGCPGPGIMNVEVLYNSNAIEEIQIEQVQEMRPFADTKQRKPNKQMLVAPKKALKFEAKSSSFKNPNYIQPSLRLSKADIKNMRARLEKNPDEPIYADLEINQYSGAFRVNRFRHTIRLFLCFESNPARSDNIRLTNNTSDDNAAIMVDSRISSGCSNDRFFRTNDRISVENQLAITTCPGETIVFSDDNAVARTTADVWTNANSDTQTVDLQPRVQTTTSVWIVDNNAVQRALLTNQAVNELIVGDAFLNTNHCGIDINTNVNFNQVANNAAVTTITNALINTLNTNCGGLAPIQNNPNFFNAGQINVYYVNANLPGARAFACNGNNIIAVGAGATPESLVHEYGHLFGLGHAHPDNVNAAFAIDVTGDGVNDGVDFDGDGAVDFTNNNIMFGGAVGRTGFTEGQAHRMNFNTNSNLNTLNFRNGVTRNCQDQTINNQCPWIATDVPNN